VFGKTVERGRMGNGKRLEEAPYRGTSQFVFIAVYDYDD
jgi:hypothetical protein